MKRIKDLLLIISIAFLIPFAVNAEDKYFNAGDVVKDVGALTHNYFSAGNSVQNDMDIDGILFTAGNDLSINGTSEYTFLAGNTVDVKGRIEKDAFIAGNKVNITSDAYIGRDLYAAASSLTISGNINGNLHLAVGDLLIDSERIDGDIKVAANRITFSGNTIINGTLKYNEDAEVTGIEKVSATEIVKYVDSSTNVEISFTDTLRETLFSIVSLIIVAYVINFFLPKAYTSVSNDFEAIDIFKKIGVGFLILICMPIASIVLLITILGAPLGFLSLIAYGVMLYLSIVFAAKFIGENIMRLFNKDNVYASLAIGIIAIKLISLIPVCGGLVYFLGMLYGLGLIYYIFKEKRATK